MGCGGSKPSNSDQTRPARPVIGAPQEVQIHVPRNRADQDGVPLQQVTRDIDRDTLLTALNHVSNYIAQPQPGSSITHISVVAVGGAVNTLHLRSRMVTHDVDIFGSDFNNQARILLDEAMHDAQRHYPNLGTDWLNTETQMWMPGPIHQELTRGAHEQNVKIFDGAGLSIYAAPWKYAFSAKVNRLMTGGSQVRPYDLQDAVVYLHEYISQHNNRPVPVATALSWAKKYGHGSNENMLRNRINREYRKVYRTDGLV